MNSVRTGYVYNVLKTSHMQPAQMVARNIVSRLQETKGFMQPSVPTFFIYHKKFNCWLPKTLVSSFMKYIA